MTMDPFKVGLVRNDHKLLLEHFGNLDNIKESDEEAIIKVIGESKYKLIKEYL